jgi:hypothetical protein
MSKAFAPILLMGKIRGLKSINCLWSTFNFLVNSSIRQYVLFGWLTGNSRLRLKKWSILQNGLIEDLSPAYSLINAVILGHTTTESAVLINDRRDGLDRGNLLEYLSKEVRGLNDRLIARTTKQLGAVT